MTAHRATEHSIGAALAALTAAGLLAGGAGAQQAVELPLPEPLESLVSLPDSPPATGATLVVALHGFGADAHDMARMAPAFTGAGFIYAALQAPYTFDADGRLARDWMLSNRRDPELAERATALSMDAIEAAVDELRARYGAGTTFLLGFSQGGRMAYRMLAAGRARGFVGVVALGAGFDAERMAATPRAEGTPQVYIGHGTADSIPLAGATGARDFLRDRGYAVTFESFVGGHEVPPRVASAVVRWMLGAGPR